MTSDNDRLFPIKHLYANITVPDLVTMVLQENVTAGSFAKILCIFIFTNSDDVLVGLAAVVRIQVLRSVQPVLDMRSVGYNTSGVPLTNRSWGLSFAAGIRS